MDEDNTKVPDPTSETNNTGKRTAIVGFNLLALLFYTVITKLIGGDAIVLDMFLIFIHVLVCIILAIANRSWFWLLSGLLVLIIGFSTCVYINTR